MGKKIASLYAEITGDTSKLDTALTGTKTKLTGVKGAASEMSAEVNSRISSMIAPAALASAAIYGIKDALDTTVSYAKQVEDLSRLIGATPEDASRLIQSADDMRVSYETLSTSMEAAIRKGFDPSIAGLETIRQKYQDLQNPIEQSKLLMDTFGRAGADMAPLMKLSSDELANLALQADKAGLTLSGANLQSAKDYALAMDGLEDSVMGVKVSLAQHLIPSLTDFINNGTAVNNTIESQKLKWMDLLPVLGAIRNVILWIQEATVGAGFAERVSTYNPYLNESVTNKKLLGGYATGGDFIVPPGFSNDSYPIRAQSGEHVSITPAGQTSTDLSAIVRELRKLPTAIRDTLLMASQ
jgi:hypothetical protein